MSKPPIAEPAPQRAPRGKHAAEELRLWADYYEATTGVLKLVRTGEITAETLSLILAGHAEACAVIERIMTIRGSTIKTALVVPTLSTRSSRSRGVR